MMNRSRQQGFSLVELIISIVLVSLAVTGVLLAYTHTVAGSADPLIRAQAVAVAESYLEEILSKPFDDPDGSDGESLPRANYDDVDDYAGLSQEPQMPDGTTLGLGAYTVSVSLSSPSLNGIPSASTWRVDVSVSHTSGESITLTGYRTDYGS